MQKKAFGIINDKVGKTLTERGFISQKVKSENTDELVSLYTSEHAAYSVIYYTKRKRVDLRLCQMTEDGPDNDWKTLADWMFDAELDGEKEANSIGNDFVDIIVGPSKLVNSFAKKKKGNNETNVTSLFLANRFANMFPEIKSEIQFEKEHYSDFRAVTFTKEKILPRVQAMIKTANKNDLLKFGKFINDMYDGADADSKALIMMLIMNSIDDVQVRENIYEGLTPNILKIAKESYKLKNKKFKPEKKKKQPRYVADTLNAKR